MKLRSFFLAVVFYSMVVDANSFAEESYDAWRNFYDTCVKEDECLLDCLRASYTERMTWLSKITLPAPTAHNFDKVIAEAINHMPSAMKENNARETWVSILTKEWQ